MKSFYIFLILGFVVESSLASPCKELFNKKTVAAQHHPLNLWLDRPKDPFPFNKIQFEDIPSVSALAVENLRQVIEQILKQKTSTFENTIEPLEFAVLRVDNLQDVFLFFNDTSQQVSPAVRKDTLARFEKVIDKKRKLLSLTKLGEKIKAIYENSHHLTKDQKMLTQVIFNYFSKNNLFLPAKKLSQINVLLNDLQKLQNEYTISLRDLKSVNIDALSFPSDTHPAVNQKIKKLENIALNIFQKRHQLAQLSGHSHFLDYRLKTTPQGVGTKTDLHEFFKRYVEALYPLFQKHKEEVEAFAIKNNLTEGDLLSNQKRFEVAQAAFLEKKFKVNRAKVLEYFNVEDTLQTILTWGSELYGLKIIEDNSLPKHDPSLKTYKVFGSSDQVVGYLYLDLFQRKNKSIDYLGYTALLAGDGMISKTTKSIPHILIATHFKTKKKAGQVRLFSDFKDVFTLLHEMGHAFHMLNQKQFYQSNASMYGYSNSFFSFIDLIEIPSTFMEHFLLNYSTVQQFAKHYKTKRTLPKKMFEKIKNYILYEKLAYDEFYRIIKTDLDITFHQSNPFQKGFDIKKLETEILSNYGIPKNAPSLSKWNLIHHPHILSADNYATLVYSYLFSNFYSINLFHKLIAPDGTINKKEVQKYKNEVINNSDFSIPRKELYKRFFGEIPSFEILKQYYTNE